MVDLLRSGLGVGQIRGNVAPDVAPAEFYEFSKLPVNPLTP
jgi:hypothetical protein